MNGSFILYRMLHAYSMLDMNVTGLQLRTVSITYTTIVGKLAAFNHTQQISDSNLTNASVINYTTKSNAKSNTETESCEHKPYTKSD